MHMDLNQTDSEARTSHAASVRPRRSVRSESERLRKCPAEAATSDSIARARTGRSRRHRVGSRRLASPGNSEASLTLDIPSLEVPASLRLPDRFGNQIIEPPSGTAGVRTPEIMAAAV
eukprot:757351-Hanusia_phi.AAC.1